MALGSDRAACAAELREAMRAQLDTLDPPAGSNVDLPAVSSNFDALGDGVFRILTQGAETVSERALDPAFWDFISALRTEVEALRAFNASLLNAFINWAPATPSSTVTFRNTVAALVAPGPTPDAPTQLNGKIR
ncbi:hypothetical protein [Winogradskya humida]|uniref:Uncharacterized protein n=1 Tax=Winogradskya humida TaxID=113566 RepID=A0ABQ3ZYF6_9ACTN|nr:hypothetical protein [Actinoplanes humidus]GIE23635.1 hypothetical protein Ahu01nite_067370 [Actinoplanes humidus]